MRCTPVLLALSQVAWAATPDEWRHRTIYQLLTDRFAGAPTNPPQCGDYSNYCGGTFAGITAHLDYIQALGFDAIWISPVVDNAPRAYHGYAQRDMFSLNSNFGTPKDLRDLADALHARGMLLMVDVVANHASSSSDVSHNRPFNLASDYHDCNGCSGCNVANYTDLIQMEHCRLDGLMDFNQTDANGRVATQLYDWIRALAANYSIDGLRVDTLPYVVPAFWKRFSDATGGMYAVGEVDNGDVTFVAPFQAPGGSRASLPGVLSYPLFWTLRSVFGSRTPSSMRALGDAWRTGRQHYSDVGLLGVFTDNHDNPRTMNQQKDVAPYRAAIAYSLLSDGIPIVYYGSEWLYAGGADPGCREPLWCPGITYNATKAPLGGLLSTLNAYRRSANMSNFLQVERFADDSMYCITKGSSNVMCFTNVGTNGAKQTRSITSLPDGWVDGTRACNLLRCSECAVVTGGAFSISLAGVDGVAVYDTSVSCSN